MEYRKLGRSGLEVSAIGLGTEYLLDQPREAVVAVIREAIARGVNYFDVFWAQPAFRDNLGAALSGYRAEVFLTAHLGAIDQNGQYAVTRDPLACAEFLDDYLRRLGTDYVDVLFLHNCNTVEDYAALLDPDGVLGLARRLQREGKARFIGLSGHNTATSRQAVESGEIDVLMFPVNLACQSVPGYQDLLDGCVAHDVGLAAMKPFGGGSLLRRERLLHVEDFQMGRTETMGAPTRFERSVTTITPLQCLAYTLSWRAVSTIVPGCKSVEELAGVLGYWDASEEERDFSLVLPDFAEYPVGQCVYCNHCLPCPAEIDVGRVISLFDEARQELAPALQAQYEALPARAGDCQACGDCVQRCPFGVEVIIRMEQAVALFGG